MIGSAWIGVNASIQKYMTNLGKAEGRLKTFSQRGMQYAKNFGMAGAIIGAAVVAIGTSTAKAAVSFEKGMAEVGTLLGKQVKQVPALSNEILKLSRDIGFSPQSLTKALYQAVSAGVDFSKSMDFLRQASRTAIAGVTDMFTAVDSLTTVVNAYGDRIENAQHYSDILFSTVKYGKTTFGELAPQIGRVATIAAQLGVPFHEVGAALALMTKKGIQTETAVMSLRQILASILKPTSEAAKRAAQLGIDFSVAALKSKGLSRFIAEVVDKTKGSSEAFSDLFGNIRALTGAMALASEEFDKMTTRIKESKGATEEAAKVMDRTVSRSIERLKANWQSLKIEFGRGILPIVNPIIKAVSWGLGKIGDLGEGIDNVLHTAWAGIKNDAKNLLSVLGIVGKETKNQVDYIEKMNKRAQQLYERAIAYRRKLGETEKPPEPGGRREAVLAYRERIATSQRETMERRRIWRARMQMESIARAHEFHQRITQRRAQRLPVYTTPAQEDWYARFGQWQRTGGMQATIARLAGEMQATPAPAEPADVLKPARKMARATEGVQRELSETLGSIANRLIAIGEDLAGLKRDLKTEAPR